MYFIFMMYTNAGEDKIIPKDATFFWYRESVLI